MDVCIVQHIHNALYRIIQAYLCKRDFIRWWARWCYVISISSIYIPSRMLHTILARVYKKQKYLHFRSYDLARDLTSLHDFALLINIPIVFMSMCEHTGSLERYSSMLLDYSHRSLQVEQQHSMLHNPKVCTCVSAHQSH